MKVWNSFQFQFFLVIFLPISFLSLALGISLLALHNALVQISAVSETITSSIIFELQFAGAMIVLVIMALVFAIFTIRRFRYSIHRIIEFAQTITLGDFSVQAETITFNEMAVLGNAFNEMTERLRGLITEFAQQISIAEEAREKAERSDQVKSAFLASMSHELRTPLNAVINFTKFVAQGDLGPVTDEQRDTLMEVVDSARHLLHLINDVLDMSKIESGSLNLFVQDDLSLEEILNSSISTAKTLLQEKPVELRESVSNLPKIRGDKQRIRQIFLNILSNACKFTEQGFIEIRAEEKDACIIFAVQDTGPGIALSDQDSVFQAFKQTQTGLRQSGGTGLGMPISKSLAEIHGGHLWLESEVGQGTTFYLKLPIKSDALTPLQF